jgi:hypothetical protein
MGTHRDERDEGGLILDEDEVVESPGAEALCK